jgi:ABC-type nickel/cobalt efflux system permease component RcnA
MDGSLRPGEGRTGRPGLIALALRSAHAILPGQSKSLVTAIALGPQARFYQLALLGLATTVAHMGSVLCLAQYHWMARFLQLAKKLRCLTRKLNPTASNDP